MVSIGFTVVIILITLLASGIAYIILNQVVQNYLFNQTTINQVLATLPGSNVSQVVNTQTTMIYFWETLPIFIVTMLILWLIVKAMTGKKEE